MVLQRELSDILLDAGAPERLAAFLDTQLVTTCALFYDCIKDVDQIEAKICAVLDPPATSLREVATIRNAWRRSKVEAERMLSGESSLPDDWEVPFTPLPRMP